MGLQERKRYEILAKFDGYCIKCRGKILAGSGATWDAGILEHLVCPPVATISRATYQAPPLEPARWKELCKKVQEQMTGKNSSRVVVDEDRKAYETDGPSGMLRSIMDRCRCSGGEAVEIARNWIDSLRKPVDEEKFQRVNQSCRREQAGVSTPANGSPDWSNAELVDWDEEA